MPEEKSFGQEVAGAMQEGAEALSAGKPLVTREVELPPRIAVWQDGGQFPGDPSASYELADEARYTYEDVITMIDGEEQDVDLHAHFNSEGLVCDMWTKPTDDSEPECIRSFYLLIEDLEGMCR